MIKKIKTIINYIKAKDKELGNGIPEKCPICFGKSNIIRGWMNISNHSTPIGHAMFECRTCYHTYAWSRFKY